MRRYAIVLRAGLLGILVLALTGCAILDAIFMSLGFERAPDVESLAGPDATILVVPGACTIFPNPVPPDLPLPNSSGKWASEDGFSLASAPPWLSVVTSRSGGVTQRRLCATEDAPVVSRLELGYLYVRGGISESSQPVTKAFAGRLFVSTVTQDLAVNPTATPAVIDPFDSSTLSANITGGVPPYTVVWTPADTLDPSSGPTVRAEPDGNTLYTVRVTDATGATVSGAVTVITRPDVLFIDAVPARNGGWDPGVRVHLFPQVEGGTPPFTYSWSPAAGLDDSTRFDPSFTTPDVGTTPFDYVVTVTDARGERATGSIDVRARGPLTVNPQATPSTIAPGQQSQLTANATVPIGALQYQWIGPGLSASNIADPIARPTVTSNYLVIVTDAFGRTQTGNVTVTVRAGPDLVVSLVDAPDPAARNVLLTYTATVANTGTDPATGVVFTQSMPFMIETGGAVTSQGTCTTTFIVGIQVTCSLGTIAAGSSATVTLAGFTFGTGTVSNTASVTLNEVDANPANNTATVTTTFLGTATSPGGPIPPP